LTGIFSHLRRILLVPINDVVVQQHNDMAFTISTLKLLELLNRLHIKLTSALITN
jgi:hypothetical protein